MTRNSRRRQPGRRWTWLALALQAYLVLAAHAQQQQQQQQQRQGEPQQISGRARLGKAPHERPSCQALTQASNQRRRLAHQAAASPPGLLALINDSPSTNSSFALDQRPPAAGAAEQQQQQQVAGAQPKQKLSTSERLFQLRQLLKSNNYDAYLVTPNDEHDSEYVADYDRRLRFISGFTGSNGYALIMLDRAVLFTDGRYALQAEQELDCNWWLVVSSEPLVDIHAWIHSHVHRQMNGGGGGLRVALDASLMSLQAFDYLDEHLKQLDTNFEFALISIDLVDIVWGNLQQEAPRLRPSESLEVHPLEFAGQVSWQEKVLRLAERMQALRARHYVMSKLDDIAWLLNLRGADIPMAPLFKAYLLVSRFPAGGSPSAGGGSSSAAAAASQATGGHVQSLEQLLASAQQQQQQQQQGDLLTPQVLQVPTGQVIKLTLYVDLRKVSRQVRDHLRLENGTSSGELHRSAAAGQQFGPAAQLGSQVTTGSRIRVELRDYEVFLMDLRERFASSGGGLAGSPTGTTTTSAMVAAATPAGQGPAPLLSAPVNAPLQPQQQQQQQQQHEYLSAQQGRLLLDAMSNVAIHVLAKNYEDRLILVEPLVQQLKSVKNDLEVQGMRQAHWRDSLAIAMLLGQLEHDIARRGRTEKWTEVSAARELEFYRSLMDLNRGQSFDTVSAYGANAAVVHYKPDFEAPPASQVLIGNQSTYLLDSGGQYLDGTTDITRTLHFGAPTDFQRETYTRVLMGAIDMMSLIFEQQQQQTNGRPAFKLKDLLARRHLFELGLDYEHGTGHGIGAYLLVHEQPALIEHYGKAASSGCSPGLTTSTTNSKQASGSGRKIVHSEPIGIRENMFTSVEPGFYRAGEFGIRLENIVVTQRVVRHSLRPQQMVDILSGANGSSTPAGSATGSPPSSNWLRFEPISLVPFEPKLIKFELLSNKQKAWLNSYNLMVRLRMTQQINHYLGRLRSAGSASSNPSPQRPSPLWGATRQNATEQEAARQMLLGLEVDAGKFQHLLEQAHKWIMAKTELIPLDVPQRLHDQQVEGAGGQRNSSRAADAHRKQSRTAGDDEWSALGADPEGQRLMLAYMSSMPFNDADAARAVATLAGRAAPSPANSSAAPSQGPAENRTNARADPFPGPLGHKCVGIECDLLLLEALNSHQQQQQAAAAAGSRRAANKNNQWPEGEAPPPALEGEPHQMLMDLFQISSAAGRGSAQAADWWALASMWPMLGLALIFVLQLAVMAYVCGGGGGGSGGSQGTSASPGRGQSAALARALGSASSLRRAQASQTNSAVDQTLALSPVQRAHQQQTLGIAENV